MNTAIYCVLRSLEYHMENNGGVLPPVFYWQIDGGPENATIVTIAIAELLVHRGLCDEVWLTRLLVGHTHEGTSLLVASLIHFGYQLSPCCRRYRRALRQLVASQPLEAHPHTAGAETRVREHVSRWGRSRGRVRGPWWVGIFDCHEKPPSLSLFIFLLNQITRPLSSPSARRWPACSRTSRSKKGVSSGRSTKCSSVVAP